MELQATVQSRPSDDPRRLRELLARTRELACRHDVGSVVVGLAAPEGDLLFPEVLAFVESELRVEDSVFRMTRERAVLFLADVALDEAQGILGRLLEGFRSRFPSVEDTRLRVGYFRVRPGVGELSVGSVLQAVFVPDSARDLDA